MFLAHKVLLHHDVWIGLPKDQVFVCGSKHVILGIVTNHGSLGGSGKVVSIRVLVRRSITGEIPD